MEIIYQLGAKVNTWGKISFIFCEWKDYGRDTMTACVSVLQAHFKDLLNDFLTA
jgi:hypothetical protein